VKVLRRRSTHCAVCWGSTAKCSASDGKRSTRARLGHRTVSDGGHSNGRTVRLPGQNAGRQSRSRTREDTHQLLGACVYDYQCFFYIIFLQNSIRSYVSTTIQATRLGMALCMCSAWRFYANAREWEAEKRKSGKMARTVAIFLAAACMLATWHAGPYSKHRPYKPAQKASAERSNEERKAEP
jgi:hypothetical protein